MMNEKKWIDLALNEPDKNFTLYILSHRASGNCRITKDIAVKYSDYNTYEELKEYCNTIM